MIRYTAKIEQAFKQGFEQGFKEGFKEGFEQGIKEVREEGRVKMHLAWVDWNKRREAAAEKDRPFTESPPPPPH